MIDINIYDFYKKIKNIYKIKEKIYLCVALNANEKKSLSTSDIILFMHD